MWGSAGYVKRHAAEMEQSRRGRRSSTSARAGTTGFYLNGREELREAARPARSRRSPGLSVVPSTSADGVDGTDNFDFLHPPSRTRRRLPPVT